MSRLNINSLSFEPVYAYGTKTPGNKQEGSLLIAGDDPPARRMLHTGFYGLGFEIGESGTGEEAIALCHLLRYDAVLLDINTPGQNGIDTCRELRRAQPRVAIVVLSANNDPEYGIEALEAGADDYVIKPFQTRELTARIRSALRSLRTSSDQREEHISIADVELHPARRLVLKAGESIHLTPKEFELLHYLMSHAGLPVARSKLLSAVWGPECVNQLEYLRTLVRQLRKKLKDDGDNPKYVLTDSHVGYHFVDPSQAPHSSAVV
jgi:two-component system, OmpR family, KDP operon response regulator KdpE